MELIKVKQLFKKYGPTEVLKGIDLTIQQNEIFGLIGHNGSGKSTFINTLTGIIKKSHGSFEILGCSDQQINKVKKRLGVMPDISNLYEQMRGIDFLMFMGKLAGDNRNKKAYQSLMKEVGLQDTGRKKIKFYSFGMKKKISIAQALLGNPDIIILDEPTSGLDPESAIQIRELIRELKEQGKTILLTSHNLDEIDKISDRVGILSDGIIKKLGTPKQLKQKAKNNLVISIRTMPRLKRTFFEQVAEKDGVNVTFKKNTKESVLVSVPSENEIPKLLNKILEYKVSLYEIKIENQSLEEVFMSI